MCLIAFAWQPNTRWQWVLAANRDEFHARPSAPLARWADAPQVLGGLDLSSGGSWLGVSDTGRLAAVTNVRQPSLPTGTPRSRGLLVSGFLQGQDSAEHAAAALQARFAEYGSCNLLLADRSTAIYTSNQPAADVQRLTPGVVGLSNARLETPWPKTRALKQALQRWLDAGEPSVQPLFAALADETRPADAALPDTGVGLARERLLSSAFIRGAQYGTRASTVLRVGADGLGEAIERRFGPDGVFLGETCLAFSWSAQGRRQE